MNKSSTAVIAFRLFASAMFWGTIPLMIGLWIWEHNLALSDMNHKVVQIILVFIMIGWAYLWNTLSEYHRLSHYTSQSGVTSYKLHYQFKTTSLLDPDPSPGYTRTNATSLQVYSNSIKDEYHVSNN